MGVEPFIKAFIASIIILPFWYISEYQQFGELQFERKCDNVVWLLYLAALTFAFASK